MSGVTYRDAGVDVARADRLMETIAGLARGTHGGEVVSHPSGYAALVRPGFAGMEDPLLAVTCDGVGTKLLVAREVERYHGLGQDLVAMSVNDLLPLGARPLLFLDYVATGKLDPEALSALVGGVAMACRESGCALVGGETAEMPGVYDPGEFDLAGFAVGVVDGARLPEPDRMRAGDVVLGLPSSGIHSNGLSLARKVLFEVADLDVDHVPEGWERSLGEELLEPTRLYVKPVMALLERARPRAMAHVTGGGLAGRGAKLVSEGLRLRLDPATWDRPAIFAMIDRLGDVGEAELARTFNLGLGFLAVVSPEEAAAVEGLGEWRAVGTVTEGERGVDLGDLSL